MSQVWYCIPSKRADGGTIPLWRKQGYRVAIWRDSGDAPVECDLMLSGDYPGYARAVNALCSEVVTRHRAVQWLVTGGDDIEPDLAHQPEDIALECSRHFDGTFGIMQPTGDRWGEDPAQPNHTLRGAYADRVCGSPWMGCEWCLRAHGGRGPLWPDFTHMFVDEALHFAAEKLGVLWQRRDLIQLHRHWARGAPGRQCPDFLREVNGVEHWNQSKRLLENLKASGSDWYQPVPVEVFG